MLYVIGLGLSDVEDVSVKGLKAIQSSDAVYLEHYTSILGGGASYKEELERFYGKPIELADRTMVEQRADEIIERARTQHVCFLVVGDPFGATTHTDLVLRATEKRIAVKVIHNASIMNAVGCCGLQLYNYGETISVCFWSSEENWRPRSYFAKLGANRTRGLHTLCLLDIKVKEKSVANLIRGRDVYEPPRFMSVAQAAAQLVEIVDEAKAKANNALPASKSDSDDDDEEPEEVNKEEAEIDELVQRHDVLNPATTLAVGLARVGRDDQRICVDTVERLSASDLGPPLHSMVVAGRLHPIEIEFMRQFYDTTTTTQQSLDSTTFDALVAAHNQFYQARSQ